MSPDSVTHVLVSFSSVLVAELDRLLPPASLLILEEPGVISARRVTQRVAEHPVVAGVIALPIQDEAGAAGIAAAVARPPAVRAVIPATEYGVVAAADLAAAWGLPGIGPLAARACRDKSLLRRTLAGTPVVQPPWTVCRSAADVAAMLAACPTGVVVKPTRRQGSLGVRVVRTRAEVDQAWVAATTLTEKARAASATPDEVIVEGRLVGAEVSVEALVRHGRLEFFNVTAKDLFPGPAPVERGHLVPAPVAAAVRDALRTATGHLVAGCAMDTGTLHAEWIVDPDRALPQLVECAVRLPGDGITDLITSAYGDSFIAAFLAVLEGRPIELGSVPTRAAGIRFVAAGAGRVSEITGEAAARAVPGITEVQLDRQVGDLVTGPTDSYSRHGHLRAEADDPGQVVAALDRAQDALHVVVTPAADEVR